MSLLRTIKKISNIKHSIWGHSLTNWCSIVLTRYEIVIKSFNEKSIKSVTLEWLHSRPHQNTKDKIQNTFFQVKEETGNM